MSTYAEVKARIAREMHRDDLTADIVTHVRSAINHYANRRTWKNEGTLQVTTTADVNIKAAPTGLREETRVAVVIGGYDYPLDKLTLEQMADRHGGDGTKGQPIEYSREDANLKFWPTPDAAYTVNVTGIYDDTALSLDADTNSWTTIGEDLIVARTRHTLCRDVTLDEEKMAFAEKAERAARNRLFGEANTRASTGKVQAGW
jgi:hypothetical protein